MPSEAAPSARRSMTTLAEGKRFEAYAERQATSMRVCAFCEKVYYRKKPMKQVGTRWICIDCLRALKETLDGLDRWEDITVLHDELERSLTTEKVRR